MKLIQFKFLIKLNFINEILASDTQIFCLRNENYVDHYESYNNDKRIRKYEECKGQRPVDCDQETCGTNQKS